MLDVAAGVIIGGFLLMVFAWAVNYSFKAQMESDRNEGATIAVLTLGIMAWIVFFRNFIS